MSLTKEEKKELKARKKAEKAAKEANKTKAQNAAEWVLTITIPVLVVLLLEMFVGKVAYVSGDSMYPSYYDRDMMIVQMIGYTPTDGDVVLANSDIEQENGKNMVIVKRVIATGGETVTIDYDNNTVTVDGEVLDESYINWNDIAEQYKGDAMYDNLETGNVTYTVPEGTVFLMGDNRNDSLDSRYGVVGFVSNDDVIGKVVATWHVGKMLAN